MLSIIISKQKFQETRLTFIICQALSYFLSYSIPSYPILLFHFKKKKNSLAVQWLGLRTFTAQGPGSFAGWGTKIPQAAQHGQ